MDRPRAIVALALTVLGVQVPAQSAAPPSAETAVSFEIQSIPDGGPVAASGRLVLEPQRGRKEAVVVTVEDGRAPGVSLGGGSLWLLRAELPGYWAFPVVLNLQPGEARRRHRIEVWRTVAVSGQLVPPGREQLPASFKAHMEVPVEPKRRDSSPAGAVVCPIQAAGRFRCDLPAETLDLSFRVPGYAAVWRTGLALRADEPLDLGKLALRRGARLSGTVRWEGEPVEGDTFGTARLQPLLARGAGSEVVAALRARRVEAAVNAAGAFELIDLEAGRYVLEVERPGYSLARISHLVLTEGEQRLLEEPLTLYRPVELAIHLQPPVDSQDRPWSVELGRSPGEQDSQDPGEPGHARTDEEGRALFGGRAPGRYDVGVSDSDGNRVFFERAVQLGGASPASKWIEIAAFRVSGRLYYGDEPAAGTLWFGGKNGSTRTRMVADEDGRFAGELAEPGRWRVEVDLANPALSVLRRVKVEKPLDGRAEVEIRLPRTALEGLVLDDRGQPRGGAEVLLSAAEGSRRVRSDGRGEFRLEAVGAGTVELSARLEGADGAWTSNALLLTVREKEAPPRVELRLARKKKVEGQILSPLGPVGGATVSVAAASPRLPWGDTVASDLTGAFRAEAPAAAHRLAITVMAPGHGLKAFEVDALEGQTLLELPLEAGRLELSLPHNAREAAAEDLQLEVYQNEISLPISMLWNWASLHGETPTRQTREIGVPALAPGSYRVCVLSREALFSGAGARACQQGYLQSGGVLRLTFREPG